MATLIELCGGMFYALLLRIWRNAVMCLNDVYRVILFAILFEAMGKPKCGAGSLDRVGLKASE